MARYLLECIACDFRTEVVGDDEDVFDAIDEHQAAVDDAVRHFVEFDRLDAGSDDRRG